MSVAIKTHVVTVLTESLLSCWVDNMKMFVSQNSNESLNFYIAIPKNKKDYFLKKIENLNNEIINIILVNLINSNKSIDKKFKGSYQHGTSLNECMSEVNKYYKEDDRVIIIDPDFFVIGKNWIQKLINSKLTNKNTSIVPWCPRWTQKSDLSVPPHLLVMNYFPSINFKPSLDESGLLKTIIKKISNFLFKNRQNLPESTTKFQSKFYSFFLVRISRLLRKDTAYLFYPFASKVSEITFMKPLMHKNDLVDFIWCKINKINFFLENFFPPGFRLINLKVDVVFFEENDSLLEYAKLTGWEFFVNHDNNVYCFHIRGYMNSTKVLKTKKYNKSLMLKICKLIQKKLI